MSDAHAPPIDPLKDSAEYLAVIIFGKSMSPSYPLAITAARGAARYSEVAIGKQIAHVAAFAKTKEDASRALTLLKYLGGSKTLQVFAKGKSLQSVWKAQEVLQCYLTALSCNDHTAHCYTVLENPFREKYSGGLALTIQLATEPTPAKPDLIDRYVFPCSLLLHRFRFQKGHPAKVEELIQAAAVEEGCDWCPHFDAKGFKKAQTVMVMKDGTVTYVQP